MTPPYKTIHEDSIAPLYGGHPYYTSAHHVLRTHTHQYGYLCTDPTTHVRTVLQVVALCIYPSMYVHISQPVPDSLHL